MERKPNFEQFRTLASGVASALAQQIGQQVSKKVTAQLDATLGQVAPDWKTYVENPRLVSGWLEQHSPRLSRALLSAASNFSDPHLVGMGLQVRKLTDETVEVSLPRRWKNQAGAGKVHIGALATLAEMASRVFWERHLDPLLNNLRVSEINARFLRETERDTRAVLRLSEAERETILFRLRSENDISIENEISIYDEREQLIAEVVVHWQFTRAAALPPGRSPRGSR
jgi:acyl-coenzyme A thioesterase PaaI-like protein